MRGQAAVAARCGGFDRLGENLVGPREIDASLDDPDVRNELDSQGIGGRKQGKGTRDQVGTSRSVAAQERPAAGAPEPLSRLAADRACRLVDRAELGPTAIGLLEVIPEHLLVLGRAFAGGSFEPARKA